MFKRNQVEEAIALVFEPGSAKPSSEMRTRLKRLLETDRGLGRSKHSADLESANLRRHSHLLSRQITLVSLLFWQDNKVLGVIPTFGCS